MLSSALAILALQGPTSVALACGKPADTLPRCRRASRAPNLPTSQPADHPTGAAIAIATRSPAPRIDGKLDDAVWQSAQPVSGFIQRDPVEGAAGSERTEVRVLYSDDALYVAIHAFDQDALRITAPLARRDDLPPSDWVGMMIDSYHDRRTAFEFAVNPAGVKRDVYHFNDGERDETWDAVWDVAVSRDAEGWSAEFRIPFSQLRFPKGGEQRFGFNVWREINRKGETQYWRLIPKNAQGVASEFGELVGFQQLSPPRRIEVTPYTLAGQSFEPAVAGNPYRTGSSRHTTAGADLRLGLTTNLTLSAALNPDFGQVEADPAVVNLSTTETFYPERRPFFTEGSDAFKFRATSNPFSDDQLFYTRRIGRAPQLSADPRGGYSQDAAEATTILGAAKIQGKTPSGWTMGLLGALTSEETASVVSVGGLGFRDVIEPRTKYGVLRLARDLRGGRTVLGVFGTLVDRDLAPGTTSLRNTAYTGGVELTHKFRTLFGRGATGGDRYTFRAGGFGSRVGGSPEAILAAQLSSVHYFQRPDIGFERVDSSRTSLSGLGGFVEIRKDAGSWLWNVQGNTRTPGLEINDLGYNTESGHTEFLSWVQRRWLTPGKLFRTASVRTNQWYQIGYDGRDGDRGAEVFTQNTLLNYWTVNGFIGTQVGASNAQALEGGPSLQYPSGGWVGLNFMTDPRRPIRLGLSWDQWDAFDGPGHGLNLSGTLAWRPSGRLDLSVNPRYSTEVASRQFVASGPVGPRTEYVVGEVQRSTLSLPTRGNFIFTPTLSFQLYAEPFISTGHYPRFKRVTDPQGHTEAKRFEILGDDQLIRNGSDVAADFDRDGVSDLGLGSPDFTVLSLRSTAVLRWEYRRASTIILVWQQDRGEDRDVGRFELSGNLGRLFRSPAKNTLLLKASWWWAP